MGSIQSLITIMLTISTSIGYANKFEAHEWGTFTSVVGSNGITQNGMYHEDEDLPDFVHGFGELREELQPPTVKPKPSPLPPEKENCKNAKVCFNQTVLQNSLITQKMETPVIYFYSDSTVNVDINVSFPEGIITETYPGPVSTFPTMKDPHVIANGKSKFSVKILNTKSANVPYVENDNIYIHARNVNSNIISSGAETEKFLFYRGLGRFQPKILITSQEGNLKISGLSAARPQAAFLIHVDESGDGRMLPLDNIKNDPKNKDYIFINARRIAVLKDHANVTNFSVIKGEQAKGKLVDELTASGLYKDEALSMVNTWEHGYLKTPGLRLLYILPRSEVDSILPLQITPAPSSLVRTFVGRMEILLDTEEQAFLAEITAKQDSFRVNALGRFAEPILHRLKQIVTAKTSQDAGLINLLDRLLKEASVGFDAKTSIK